MHPHTCFELLWNLIFKSLYIFEAFLAFPNYYQRPCILKRKCIKWFQCVAIVSNLCLISVQYACNDFAPKSIIWTFIRHALEVCLMPFVSSSVYRTWGNSISSCLLLGSAPSYIIYLLLLNFDKRLMRSWQLLRKLLHYQYGQLQQFVGRSPSKV